LRALGDPHRQRILLLFEPDEELSMLQILDTTPLSRTAVSHHLRVMREAGVLSAEKVGKEMFYRIDKDYVRDQLAAVITLHRRRAVNRCGDAQTRRRTLTYATRRAGWTMVGSCKCIDFDVRWMGLK
jgi:DNA-binding transcriptional ArsR family regulator